MGREALYSRRALTAEDLTLAQQRLHYYVTVLLVEEWDTSLKLLTAAFGWRYNGSDAGSVRAGSRFGSDAASELAAHPRALAALEAANVWDLQLYAYAAKLHAQQLRVATSRLKGRA